MLHKYTSILQCWGSDHMLLLNSRWPSAHTAVRGDICTGSRHQRCLVLPPQIRRHGVKIGLICQR